MTDLNVLKGTVTSIPSKLDMLDVRPEIFHQHYPYLNIYDWVTGSSPSPDPSPDPGPDPEPTPDPPVTIKKYVQDLINEGYAKATTGSGGTYVEIFDTCPYTIDQVVDVAEVASNTKKLSDGVNNTIIWNNTLPDGWDCSSIYDLYNHKTMTFSPRARMFWGLTCIPDTFELTFPSAAWSVNDYPWGSGGSNDGMFAPRYNHDKEQEYADKQFRATPKNVTINFPYHYSSVAQTLFTQMEQTEVFTLNCATEDIWNNLFECHDVTGMFEGCYELETLNINGAFSWWAIRTCHNMFRYDGNLKRIPYSTVFGERDHTQNILYPRFDGVRGTAACEGLFNAIGLEYIGPVLNMNAVSLNGCTVDGYQQSPLGSTYPEIERAGALLFNCPELTDVRIINLGNNSWNFNDTSTKTYIPKMDVTSIEYLLNHVKDETGNNYSITFSNLHQQDVSASAIALAESKGWTINFV